jgi:transcriptional regulator with PAS, ATPase and Fis domain
VTLGQGKKQQHFFLDVRVGDVEQSVVTFQKAETLRKKVNRVIGSNAHFTFDDIIGHSPGITNTIALAKIAAENNTKVLIFGESGTGKELFAQAIHNAGKLREGPFIALNCGALPKSLIESELFGYERGAFTGAKREGSSGKFELADGGSLFLDEIGDMPFDVQVSLLRVLQVKEVCRIGGNRPIKIDVRIIAATNKNLLAAIAEKTFRSDLYYRLNVFNIYIPPLRERKSDIRPLAAYFLEKYSKGEGSLQRTFSDSAYTLLESLEWRGNVRELENLVEQAVHISRDKSIDSDFLERLTAGRQYQAGPAVPAPAAAAPPAFALEKDAAFSLKRKDEKTFIKKALEETGGNIRKAANLLEVSRRTLYRKIRTLGIDHRLTRKQGKGGPIRRDVETTIFR